MPGPAEAQKMHDAFKKNIRNTEGALGFFDSEYSRQYYIDQLTPAKIDEQITLLSRADYQGITNHAEILTSLKELKSKLGNLKSKTDTARSDLKLDISSPIEISYKGDFGDEQTKYGRFTVPRGGFYLQSPETGANTISVIWEKDQKTLHSVIINDIQFLKQTDGSYKNTEGKVIQLSHDANTRKIVIRSASEAKGDTTLELFKNAKYTLEGKNISATQVQRESEKAITVVINGDLFRFEIKNDAWNLTTTGYVATIDITKNEIKISKKIERNGAPASLSQPLPGVQDGAIAAPTPAPAPAPAALTGQTLPERKKSEGDPKKRTAEQVLSQNTEYITSTQSQIDQKLTALVRNPLKNQIEGFLKTPNNQNIRAFQSMIGMKQDGDIGPNTLKVFLDWNGEDKTPKKVAVVAPLAPIAGHRIDPMDTREKPASKLNGTKVGTGKAAEKVHPKETFTFAEGFPEGDKEALKDELEPFLDAKKIVILNGDGIKITAISGLRGSDKITNYVRLNLSNNETIYIRKIGEIYIPWTPSLDRQIQIGKTMYDVSIPEKTPSTILLSRVIDLDEGMNGAERVKDFSIDGKKGEFYYTNRKGFMQAGSVKFELKDGVQTTQYTNKGVTSEVIVRINISNKTIITDYSPRQKVIDALNKKGQTASFSKTPNMITVGEHEVTTGQAKAIAKYQNVEVDIGDGKTEKKVMLKTDYEKDGSINISHLAANDDFFIVNITRNGIVSPPTVKRPSWIPGIRILSNDPTGKEVTIRNDIETLVKSN